MNHKLFEGLFKIGLTFAETGLFEGELLRSLAKPERYPAYFTLLCKLLAITPLLSMYWDGQLKKKGVYEKCFARPYVK
jgi:hypothetical protein